MPKPILVLLLIIATTIVQVKGQLTFVDDVVLETGDACATMHKGVKVNGVCSPISNCSSILTKLLRRDFNVTVCGFDGNIATVCCPNATNNDIDVPRQSSPELNLKQNLECQVVNSNDTGVIKFLSDCPELHNVDASAHVNKLCTDEICYDLVCCPVILKNRLKNVCWSVDHPIDTLNLRLLINSECTVKQLNIKGRYQTTCAYAERNPHLKPLLQDVCTDAKCDGWYCCPIENEDYFYCTAGYILQSTAVLVGPKCVDSKSGRNGTCKHYGDCSYYDVESLEKCGQFCCHNYYCCPDKLIEANQTISSRECNSYTKYLSKQEIEVPMNLYINQSSCMIVSPAGGWFVVPGEYPHMAALGYKPENEILWKCGGSLVSNRYVLTAGHCLHDHLYGSVKKVRLGVLYLLIDITIEDCPGDFDVLRLIPHPEYNPRFVYNDIGLIELAETVKFNFHIRPLCLPQNSEAQEYYISMGWGATGPGENSTDRLIKVFQDLFTYEECQRHYDVGRRYPEGINNETHICAGSRKNIQSTCPGDSGGPLVADHPTIRRLVYAYGLVSFGNPCGFRNSPGLYTNIFPYVKWIEGIVWTN